MSPKIENTSNPGNGPCSGPNVPVEVVTVSFNGTVLVVDKENVETHRPCIISWVAGEGVAAVTAITINATPIRGGGHAHDNWPSADQPYADGTGMKVCDRMGNPNTSTYKYDVAARLSDGSDAPVLDPEITNGVRPNL